MKIREKIAKIKKIHSIVSSILFIVVLTFCIFNAKELNLIAEEGINELIKRKKNMIIYKNLYALVEYEEYKKIFF
jgi:hypothetical protein